MKKKSTLAALLLTALLSGSPASVMAQNYNFGQLNWKKMVDLFATALQHGKNFPTDEEIASKMGMTTTDLSFIKSHVQRRDILDQKGRLIKNTYADRRVWMNLPMGSGSGGDAGYPTGVWHNDVFSLWNYTALWGSWNHSVAQIPGAWTDAAHKNGCDILGGTIFFDGASSAGAYNDWITYAGATTSDPKLAYDNYMYVKPLIHMLMYFGMDGVNINWEYQTGTVGNYKGFHKALYKYAKQVGFDGFHLGLYGSSSQLTAYQAPNWYADSEGQISDLMLNYNGEGQAETSIQNAKQANSKLGAKGLWQGFWIVNFNKDWESMADKEAQELNICLWGEHKDSRFWSYNSGSSTMEQQDHYQQFLERTFSGGNRNPLNKVGLSYSNAKMEWAGDTPPMSNWKGFADMVPERSTVKGSFPFATNFCLGNGDRYNYRGKKVSGAWYNMSAQDIVPTYRWLVLKANEKVSDAAQISKDVTPSFTHEDAFTGGTSLRLKATGSTASDIVLYRTDLTTNGAKPYALVATKKNGEKNGQLKLILFTGGQWKAYDIPQNGGNSWKEHRISLEGLAHGSKVEYVGLRVENAENGFDAYVGELQLNDGNTAKPDEVQNVDVTTTSTLVENGTTTVDLKMAWGVNHVANEYGVVYNKDANIDHFEVIYRASDANDANVVEVGRTSQWAAFIPALDITGAKKPQVAVVAVSTDLKTVTKPEWHDIKTSSEAGAKDPFGSYGQSFLDTNAEGYNNAVRLRGVERFTVKGTPDGDYKYELPYADYLKDNSPNGVTNSARFLNYHHADKTLKVKQGETYEFTLKGFDAQVVTTGTKDDCRYCFVGGWMDFDGSGTFNYGKGVVEQPFWKDNGFYSYADGTSYANDPDKDQSTYPLDNNTKDGTEAYGERVFRAGTLRKGNPCLVKGDGLKGKITIPADAHVGKSRLRIVYSDAWFAGAFGPGSKTNKGYTLDIDVDIVGDNQPGRTYVDKHDVGNPDNWTIVTAVDKVANVTGVPSVKVVNGRLVFENTSKAEIYTVDGRLVQSIVAPVTAELHTANKTVLIVKLHNNKTVKSVKVVL